VFHLPWCLASQFRVCDDFPGEQVVGVGAALGDIEQGDLREEDVVVDKEGAVIDLDEEVFPRGDARVSSD